MLYHVLVPAHFLWSKNPYQAIKLPNYRVKQKGAQLFGGVVISVHVQQQFSHFVHQPPKDIHCSLKTNRNDISYVMDGNFQPNSHLSTP